MTKASLANQKRAIKINSKPSPHHVNEAAIFSPFCYSKTAAKSSAWPFKKLPLVLSHVNAGSMENCPVWAVVWAESDPSHFKTYASSVYAKKNAVYYFQISIWVPENRVFKICKLAKRWTRDLERSRKASFVSVSVKRRLQTADCRLQTGGKMQTEGKMQTADCRPGVKCRLQTADQG